MSQLDIIPLEGKELGENLALFSGSRFMQTRYWAEFKGKYGFSPLFFKLNYNGTEEGLVVLIRPLFKGLKLAYIPHGPSEKLNRSDILETISSSIKGYLPKGTLFIRYDLVAGTSGEVFPGKLNGKLIKSLSTIQVPDTTILNIDRSDEEILGSMHKKTRYNIKLADKKGVTVREASFDEIETWYNIYEITAKRDGIAVHSLDYYKDVYKSTKDREECNIKLLFAEHEGEVLAGIFVLFHREGATYLYGASTNSKRNLMPAYLLQWEAIKVAIEYGAKWYDFFGIPPINDKNHPMYGLYRFKVGFGGEVIHRYGAYDYPLSIIYYPLRVVEALRTFYYKRIRG